MVRYLLLILLLLVPRANAQSLYDMTPVTQRMQQLVDTHGLAGASVYANKSGVPILRQSFGGYDANTRIPIASASKWVSALTIARVVEKGQLAWTDTVGEFFPAAPAATHAITLAQLYSHTSGLPYDDAVCLSNQSYTLASCAAQILNSPLIGTPGSVFAYGGNSMQVAARMAEVATGKAWDDIFIDEMVLPLGLTATDWAGQSPQPGYVRRANPRVAGGARTSLDDYASIVDMVLARGRHRGAQFLAETTLVEMERDHVGATTVIYAPPNATLIYAPPNATPGWGYGLGQWIEEPDTARRASWARPTVSSPGAYGFTPWADLGAGIAGIVMVQGSGYTLRDDILEIEALLEQQTYTPPMDLPRRSGSPRATPAPRR